MKSTSQLKTHALINTCSIVLAQLSFINEETLIVIIVTCKFRVCVRSSNELNSLHRNLITKFFIHRSRLISPNSVHTSYYAFDGQQMIIIFENKTATLSKQNLLAPVQFTTASWL